MGLKANRVKELFLKLAPRGRGDDDSPPWPIEKAPESGGNEDSRGLARSAAGGQGRRMAGFDMAKALSLPLVRPNSKDALGKLKDSEPGFGSIHGDKISFASDLSPVGRCEQCPRKAKYAFDGVPVPCGGRPLRDRPCFPLQNFSKINGSRLKAHCIMQPRLL